MFRILGRTSGDLVDVKVEDRLTPSDFVALRRKLTPLVDEFGKIRLLFDLSEFEGFEGEGLWDEHTFESARRVERVALVVPERHAAHARRVFGLDAREVEDFAPAHAEQAWSWLTQRGDESDTVLAR